MRALQAPASAIAVSVCVSTTLVAGLMTPLRPVLRRACPGPEGENFWACFTVLMLYLSPLLIALGGIGLRMATLRMPPRA